METSIGPSLGPNGLPSKTQKDRGNSAKEIREVVYDPKVAGPVRIPRQHLWQAQPRTPNQW